jgi:hypothetical protein
MHATVLAHATRTSALAEIWSSKVALGQRLVVASSARVRASRARASTRRAAGRRGGRRVARAVAPRRRAPRRAPSRVVVCRARFATNCATRVGHGAARARRGGAAGEGQGAPRRDARRATRDARDEGARD